MDHDDIQLLAARCLTQPAFLAKALQMGDAGPARRQTKRGVAGTREAEAVATIFGREQLKRMALFGGFITKVRHRALRKYLPATLRLLEHFGIELGFFARFFPHYAKARARGPLTTALHLALLEKELLAYAKRLPVPEQTILRNVFTHEKTLWEIFQDAPEARSKSQDAIVWRGRLMLRRYQTQAPTICQALRDFSFRRGTPYFAEAELSVVYWRALGKPGVSVFEVDELTGLIFSEVDGRRSIPQLAASFAKRGLPEIGIEQLTDFFSDAASRGFVNPPKSPSVKPLFRVSQ